MKRNQHSPQKFLPLLLILLLLYFIADYVQEPAKMPVHTDGLAVHFIDVGQADCALLLCGDEAMLIDGGNVADSDLIYAYLQKHNINHLKYIVDTHAHEDHVGGLAGALNEATIDYAFAPVTNYDSKAFRNYLKYVESQNKKITIPHPCDKLTLGEAEITVLGPLYDYEETNDTSIVLRVVYGKTSFLFTGDAETEAEEDMLAAGRNLQSTVLKVGHHGSSTSSSDDFLAAVNPEYAVISCETGNSYGHPHQETMQKLHKAGIAVYRTDLQGTIIAQSDGETITFTPLGPADDGYNYETGEQTYIINTNSLRFHKPNCSGLQDANSRNQQSFTGSRDELIRQGYSPCGTCQP